MKTKIRNQIHIRNLIENRAKSVRDVNIDGILVNHSSDIAMFDVPPPLQSLGIAAYKKTWDLLFQYSRGGKGSFELVDLKITAVDMVAFCDALMRISKGAQPASRLTIGLLMIDGKWLITYEHHSVPAEIKD